jgi:hypothetical protein
VKSALNCLPSVVRRSCRPARIVAKPRDPSRDLRALPRYKAGGFAVETKRSVLIGQGMDARVCAAAERLLRPGMTETGAAMSKPENPVQMAVIGAAHGIKGESCG